MICKNCGKEIKDDIAFCGYCGAKVEMEETEPVSVEPVIEPEEVIEKTMPEEPVEEPAEEVVEDVVEAEVLQPAEEEPSPAEPEEIIDAEESEEPQSPAVEETQSLEQPEEDTTVITDQDWSDEPEESKKPKGEKLKALGSGIATGVKGIPWGDLKVFGSILKNPLEDHEMKTFPLLVTYAVMLITNMIFFRDFMSGLIVSILIFTGLLLMYFIEERSDFHFRKTIVTIAHTLVLPVICMLISVILFSIFLNSIGHVLYNYKYATGSMSSTLIAALFFLFMAFISLVIISTKRMKNSSAYVQILICSVIVLLLIMYFSFFAASSITSLF